MLQGRLPARDNSPAKPRFVDLPARAVGGLVPKVRAVLELEEVCLAESTADDDAGADPAARVQLPDSRRVDGFESPL